MRVDLRLDVPGQPRPPVERSGNREEHLRGKQAVAVVDRLKYGVPMELVSA